MRRNIKTRSEYPIKLAETFYAFCTIRGKKFMRTTGETNEWAARQRLKEIVEPFQLVDKVGIRKPVASRIDESQAAYEDMVGGRDPPDILRHAASQPIDSSFSHWKTCVRRLPRIGNGM